MKKKLKPRKLNGIDAGAWEPEKQMNSACKGEPVCSPFKLMNQKVGTRKLEHQVLRFATYLNHNLFVAIVNIQYLNIENTGGGLEFFRITA